MRARILTFSVLFGLALSLYTLAIKWGATPCFSSACSTVIGSKYGTLLGIPLSVFSVVAWVGVIALPQRLRTTLLLAMVAATLWFAYLQAFVLSSFCLFCCLHGLAVLVAASASYRCPTLHIVPKYLYPAAIFLFIGLVSASQHYAAHQLQAKAGVAPKPTPDVRIQSQTQAPLSAVTPQIPAQTAVTPAQSPKVRLYPHALPLLSPKENPQAALIISLGCPHCLQLLRSAVLDARSASEPAPSLYFAANPKEMRTRYFVAAILSSTSAKSEAFGYAFALASSNNAFATADGEIMRVALLRGFPNLEQFLPQAEALIASHFETINRMQITGVPVLVTPRGSTTELSPDTLFQ